MDVIDKFTEIHMYLLFLLQRMCCSICQSGKLISNILQLKVWMCMFLCAKNLSYIHNSHSYVLYWDRIRTSLTEVSFLCGAYSDFMKQNMESLTFVLQFAKCMWAICFVIKIGWRHESSASSSWMNITATPATKKTKKQNFMKYIKQNNKQRAKRDGCYLASLLLRLREDYTERSSFRNLDHIRSWKW